jgi:pimeloyl-ACP methyl ester carboxylesterase
MRLLLLHGVGGNRRLWDGLAELSSDPVIAPDLAGHGGAPRLGAYGFESYARDLLARCRRELAEGPLRIIGHSLGGAVGITLAAMDTGLDIRGVVAVGVKTRWTDADVASMHRVADKGVVWLADEQAAAERYVKLGGLAGILTPGSPAARQGIACEDGRWRFAADPEVFRVTPASLGPYVGALRCPLVLAAGEADAMAPPDTLAHLGAPVVGLPGLGHNAHVEDPRAVLGLLDRLAAFPRGDR